jgi:hypothetical protein
MKIGYPVTQANHPLTTRLFGRERRGDNVEAEMREDTAEFFPQCTAMAVVQEAGPPPPKASTLSALLAEEKLAQKRSQNTIDPSRQLPGYLRKETSAVASGSRDKTTNAVASGSRDKTNVVASGSRNIVCILIRTPNPTLICIYSRICVLRQHHVRIRVFLKCPELRPPQPPN